jgi:hypothetical protein
MKIFPKFMAKIPAEYLPKVEEAITHAAQVLADRAPSSADIQAVADELQSLQQKVKFDSAKAAANAWKEAIEHQLKAHYAARLVDEGVDPKNAAKEASELLTPEVNKLLRKVEFVRGVTEKKWMPKVNWKNAASTALGWGVIGTLVAIGYHYYTPPANETEPAQPHKVTLKMPKVPAIPESNVNVSVGDPNLTRFSHEAVEQLQKDWQAQEKIRMSDESIRLMDAALAQPVRIEPAPAAIARLPPAIRAIAAQPVTVTITRPNEASKTYQQTIGAVVISAPESEREQVQRVISTWTTNEPAASAKPEPAPQTKREFSLTSGTAYGQAMQIKITGAWKNQ